MVTGRFLKTAGFHLLGILPTVSWNFLTLTYMQLGISQAELHKNVSGFIYYVIIF